jgi:Gamma-glutamyltranspeptidase
MVSMIQSNFRWMGSGLMADGLGFMFQDRGELFSLKEGHPCLLRGNCRIESVSLTSETRISMGSHSCQGIKTAHPECGKKPGKRTLIKEINTANLTLGLLTGSSSQMQTQLSEC